MRLTIHTDYAIRTLIYLAIHPSRLVTIGEIADKYNISKNHLMKVAQELVNHKYLISERGRNGGLKLAMAPEEINVGDVVRKMETDFSLVACFNKYENDCAIASCCGAKSIFKEALNAFLEVIDRYSLADMLDSKKALISVLVPNQNLPANGAEKHISS